MLLIASLLLSIATASQEKSRTLTFDEALSLAGGVAAADRRSAPMEIGGLRSRLPDLRLETTGNLSRTFHPFTADPLESNVASSIIAFDYPLWSGGIAASQNLRPAGFDEGRFIGLVEAFSDLYLIRQQIEVLRPIADRLSVEAETHARLLAAGEMSNLMVEERRQAAISHATRLLDLEARRAEASARLQSLTGLDAEPRPLLDLSRSAPSESAPDSLRDARIEAAAIGEERSRVRLAAARAASGFKATLSGSAGVAVARSHFNDVTSRGTFGVYALRMHLAYPLFRGTSATYVAEARADLRRSIAERDEAVESARQRLGALRDRHDREARRIELLRESVRAAERQQQSLRRLVQAGLRLPSDLVRAEAEEAQRRSDLLAAEVGQWKTARLIEWMAAGNGQP